AAAAPGAFSTREAAASTAVSLRRVPHPPTSTIAVRAANSRAHPPLRLARMSSPSSENRVGETRPRGYFRASTYTLHWSEYSHSKLPGANRSRRICALPPDGRGGRRRPHDRERPARHRPVPPGSAEAGGG